MRLISRNPQDNRQASNSSNPEPHEILAAARRATRVFARSHYENFIVASWLLPRPLRQPFYDVYAFCRTADDVADESDSPAAALAGLDRLERELNLALEGHPESDLFIALGDTVKRFKLPKQSFLDLLTAFRQDQVKTRYENKRELLEYCRYSAIPVGRIVLQLGETSDPTSLHLSDQICTGLQLANFWQDLARDQAKGRTYLPKDEMMRFGVTKTMLRESSTPGPLRELLSDHCDWAEECLLSGLPLADRVPQWLRADIRLFVYGGLATLEAIRRIDFDVLRVRPTVAKTKQMSLLARATLGLL